MGVVLLLAGASGVPAAPSTLLTVEGIRTGLNGDGTRLVIDLGRKSDFRAFHLSNPYRIVLDIEAAKWVTPKSGLMPGGLVRGYRSGNLADGVTRVIFDLGRAAVITNAQFMPKDSFRKDRIVVDLMPSSPNWFTQRMSEVFGNRNLKGKGSAPYAVSGFGEARDRAMRQETVPDIDADVTGRLNTMGKPGIPAPNRKPGKNARKYVIVIDAGHGGEDPGALGKYGVREKNITLSVARMLERILTETGRYRPVLTRSTDKYIKLRDRVSLARKAGADLFISIHADKIERVGVTGASIYTLSQNASDAETARLADQENNSGVVAGVDLAQESQDVADILLDLAMREKMNESKMLAKYITSGFANKNIRMLPNSHRAAGFAVLKAPDVPSVLIETGFLSNPNEAKLLSTAAFQRRLAEGILIGVDAYFRKMSALQKL